MTVATQAAIRQDDRSESGASNAIDRFIEILNNRLKDDPSAQHAGRVRTRGFVVVVRGAPTAKPARLKTLHREEARRGNRLHRRRWEGREPSGWRLKRMDLKEEYG